ncbi:MAG: signal peptide peptidase SppA [Campylobacterota bacterium]
MIKRLFTGIKNTLGFIQNHLKALIFLLVLFLLFAPSGGPSKPQANLMQVDLEGMILDHQKVVDQLQKAAKSEHIKGILLNVNSPGGMVPPSIEISKALQRIDKPVIAYASGTMASGSYYASIHADKIYANPGSLIGSIGVIFEGMNFGGLLDKAGISPQSVKVGTYKEAGTPMRQWSQAERAELQQIADDVYEMFVTDVAKARDLNTTNSDEFADAHIYNANRAKTHGLIDEVMTMHEAKKQLETMAEVDSAIWYEKDRIEKLMDRLEAKAIQIATTYMSGLKAGY